MTTLQMEIALMKYCNFRQNIVVPNVSWGIVRKDGGLWHELHECDILKLTKTGYAVEYEIKVSESDFKADFKKKHRHNSRFIKQFYYAVPINMLSFAKDNLPRQAGLVTVDNRYKVELHIKAPIRENHFKWKEKEINKLMHLGTMRILNLKRIIHRISN